MRTLVRVALLTAMLTLAAQPALARENDPSHRAEPRQEKRESEHQRAEKAEKPEKAERQQRGERENHDGKATPQPSAAVAPELASRAVAPPSSPASSAPPAGPAPVGAPSVAAVSAAPALPALPPNPRRFGYGASVADLRSNGSRLHDMGFEYVKSWMAWSGAEPSRGSYNWADADNIAGDAERAGLRLVLRVDTPPDWAATGGGNRPPADPESYGSFMGALAAHLRGRVVAYEIWNEPNLASEWGGQRPNPEQYAQLLRSAYAHVKAADSGALVVSAGMASTGGDGGATTLDDLQFIRRMYAAGAKGSFDALGSHPYGFSTAPDQPNPNGVTDFLRAADQYQVMVENGDGDKAVWATEVGWIDDPSAFGHPEYLNDPLWAGRQWQKVDPSAQASYLTGAYRYAYANWPWMGVMLLFNLDFSTAGYYAPAEQMRWYSVLNGDGTARPAFDALRAMAKPIR